MTSRTASTAVWSNAVSLTSEKTNVAHKTGNRRRDTDHQSRYEDCGTSEATGYFARRAKNQFPRNRISSCPAGSTASQESVGIETVQSVESLLEHTTRRTTVRPLDLPTLQQLRTEIYLNQRTPILRRVRSTAILPVRESNIRGTIQSSLMGGTVPFFFRHYVIRGNCVQLNWIDANHIRPGWYRDRRRQWLKRKGLWDDCRK